MMEVGCYPVSMARYLAGEPTRVSAEQLLGGDGVDVVMAGVLRFADGVIAHFDSGLAMPHRIDVEVVGSTGSLRVASPWHPQPDGIELWREGASTAEVIQIAAADPYALEVADLGAAARGERAPLLGRADALGQARAIEALSASAAAGSTVSL